MCLGDWCTKNLIKDNDIMKVTLATPPAEDEVDGEEECVIGLEKIDISNL